MSKRKERKKRQQLETIAKSEEERLRKTSITRRKLLKILGIGAGATAIIGPAIWCAARTPSIDWSFLERNDRIPDYLKTIKTPEDFTSKYVPIGFKLTLGQEQMASRTAVDFLFSKNPYLETKGLKKEDLVVSRQIYGVPEEDKYANSYREFAKRAVDFMYDSIDGLTRLDFEWVNVKEGDDFIKINDFLNKAFVCKNMYLVFEAEKKTENLSKPGELVGEVKKHAFGGTAFGVSNWGCIVLSSYTTVIHAPISEFLHKSVPDIKGGIFSDVNEGEIAEETLVEGISYCLALELAKKLDMPDGVKRAKRTLSLATPDSKYRYLPQSVKFIQEHGLQKTFDIYRADPRKFMEMVKSYS